MSIEKYEKYIIKSTDADQLDEWDNFVNYSPQGSIFCFSWWLRAVCPNGFDILILKKNGEIVAGMPVPYLKRWGLKMVKVPPFSHTLGILLMPSNKKSYQKRLSEEMNMVNSIIDMIPNCDYFSIFFHYNFDNWLPFYWAGYKQTTKYSYIISDIRDYNYIISNFSQSKRKNIKKAEKNIQVFEDLSASEFYSHHAMSLGKKGKKISYSYDNFKRIYEFSYGKTAGKTWYAADNNNNIHSCIFVVYDHRSAYFLISSIDPYYSDSHSLTLLLRDAIYYLSQYTVSFDFEGSMIRGVENSFRKFGGVQTPYFYITRMSRKGKFLKAVQKMFKLKD